MIGGGNIFRRLSVAAAVRGNHTFGDPTRTAYPVKAILIVDEKANPEQRLALAGFARRMGGDFLDKRPIQRLGGGTKVAGDIDAARRPMDQPGVDQRRRTGRIGRGVEQDRAGIDVVEAAQQFQQRRLRVSQNAWSALYRDG